MAKKQTTPSEAAETLAADTAVPPSADSWERDGRGPLPGDQVQYVVIKQPGQPTSTWQAEVTAVYDGGRVDLVVQGPGGYEGVAQGVAYGLGFGCWCWQDEQRS